LWDDGSSTAPIENLVVSGNRFLNEANNTAGDVDLGSVTLFARVSKPALR
jgi:hypothetical protein